MEHWQREHILKHLVELIKNTTINTNLIASLKAKNVITDNDAEAIEHQILTPSEKCRKLYEILPNKSRSFEVLIQILTEARQTGAAKILREHTSKFRDYGAISIDENHVLGTGASSKVFKGKFESREVAVKVLHTNLVDAEMITREVEFLRKLDSHENIIRHFIAESQDTCIYIALELCVISLQDEVNMKLLNINQTSTLLECAKGLDHLHKHNVVHRDLKPANILLTASKHVKIADFGLSKQIPIGMSSITVHTGGFGTIDWMAPEVLEYLQQGMAKNETLKMSKSTDIFSLGCIFYFTLTDGLHPFGNSFDRLYNISHYNPKLIEGKTSEEWTELIARMISRSPEARPKTYQILNSKRFAPSTSPHVQPDGPNANNDVRAKNEDYTLQRKISKSASEYLQETFQEQLEAVNMETEDLSLRNQGHSKIVLPNTSEELAASTTNTDLRNPISEPAIRSVLGQMLNRVDKIFHHDPKPQPLLFGINEEIYSEECQLSPDIKRCIDICNQKLQEVEYKGRGFTLLHMAVELEHKATVEHLISHGDDVNKGNWDGITPLHWSCRSEKCMKEIFPILIKHGGNINVINKKGENMLFMAAEWGASKETLEAIVKSGVDTNLKTKDGQTAMYTAFKSGNSDTIKYFISIGLDMNSRNKNGATPLHSIIYAKTNFFETLNVAMDNGADINAVQKDGHSTLHLATWRGLSKEKLEALVRAGADVNLKNNEGATVMHYAVCGGYLESVKYFIQIGVAVNERNNKGGAPIHYLNAANHNFKEILNVLLKHGADINSRDNNGRTLLRHLEKNWKQQAQIDIVKRLGGTK